MQRIATGILKADDIVSGVISKDKEEKDIFSEIVKLVSTGNISLASCKLKEQYVFEDERIRMKIDPVKFAVLYSIIQMESNA